MELARTAPTLTKLYVPVLLFLGAILAISHIRARPFSYYVFDATMVRGTTPLAGIVSNIGLLIWCATSCICLFCVTKIENEKKDAYFLLSSGLLSTFLLLDDLVMLHVALPLFVPWVPKISIYFFYAIVFSIHIYCFRKIILKTDFVFLTIACLFFATSIVADLIWISGLRGHNIVEDGCKFFGIVTWAFYHIRVCSRFINDELDRRTA